MLSDRMVGAIFALRRGLFAPLFEIEQLATALVIPG